ncbi:MAG TPA: hypothetical protein PKB06_09265, partial [Actinotalea sp.]|nr:hypothetical protein [Actinotalea sp.]
GLVTGALLARAMGQQAVALIGEHYDEVKRLVDTRRRVTVAWHRMHGPALLREIARTHADTTVVVPAQLDGRDVREGLARLIAELEAEGSLPLRADLARHRELLLSLPGLDLADLEAVAG